MNKNKKNWKMIKSFYNYRKNLMKNWLIFATDSQPLVLKYNFISKKKVTNYC